MPHKNHQLNLGKPREKTTVSCVQNTNLLSILNLAAQAFSLTGYRLSQGFQPWGFQDFSGINFDHLPERRDFKGFPAKAVYPSQGLF